MCDPQVDGAVVASPGAQSFIISPPCVFLPSQRLHPTMPSALTSPIAVMVMWGCYDKHWDI